MACTLAQAQNTTPPAPSSAPAPQGAAAQPQSEPAERRTHQRTEHILVEDAGSRVDEVRVGGQTQSITVQPKTGNLPEYEVQSPDGARNRTGSRSGAETTTAPRVWNVLKF